MRLYNLFAVRECIATKWDCYTWRNNQTNVHMCNNWWKRKTRDKIRNILSGILSYCHRYGPTIRTAAVDAFLTGPGSCGLVFCNAFNGIKGYIWQHSEVNYHVLPRNRPGAELFKPPITLPRRCVHLTRRSGILWIFD